MQMYWSDPVWGRDYFCHGAFFDDDPSLVEEVQARQEEQHGGNVDIIGGNNVMEAQL